MPKGVYKRTEYHVNKLKVPHKGSGIYLRTVEQMTQIKNLGKAAKGVKRSTTTREKIRQAKQGKPSLATRGEKHWQWKGGITPKGKVERVRFRNLIQKEVFKRDNFTCQLCGLKGGYLQVDHIQSWVEYVELRFSMDNCRTLCMGCHYLITWGRPMPRTIKTWGHNLKLIRSRRLVLT